MLYNIHILLHAFAEQKRLIGMSDTTILRVTANVSMLTNDVSVDDIRHLKHDHVNQWAEAKLAKGVALKTIAAYGNSIRAFIRFCASEGIESHVRPCCLSKKVCKAHGTNPTYELFERVRQGQV